jgi:hypothetical protein
VRKVSNQPEEAEAAEEVDEVGPLNSLWGRYGKKKLKLLSSEKMYLLNLF